MNRKTAGSAAAVASLLALVAMGTPATLNPGTSYRVTISKVSRAGTLSEYSHVGAVAGPDGTLAFGAPAPSRAEANFAVVSVVNASGTVLRRSLSPTTPAGTIASVGVNPLTTSQTDGILAAFEAAGTDDPLLVAYGFLLLRSPDLSPSEIASLSTILQTAVRGFQGFADFLERTAGESPTRIAALRECIMSPGIPGVDLGDLFAEIKAASELPSGSEAALARADGRVADLLLDASRTAGIPADRLIAAADAAAQTVESGLGTSTLPSYLRDSVRLSLSRLRVRLVTLAGFSGWVDSMNALSMPDADQQGLQSTLAAWRGAIETLEASCAPYHQSPEIFPAGGSAGLLLGNELAYAFNQMAISLRCSDADRIARTLSLHTTLGAAFVNLPADFLLDRDLNGNLSNATITRLLLVRWFEEILLYNQALSYSRMPDAECPVPAGMSWLAGGRSTFATGNDSLDAFLGVLEDLRIAEFSYRTSVLAGTPSARAQARLDLERRKAFIASSMQFSSTVYAGPLLETATRAPALVALMLQPSME